MVISVFGGNDFGGKRYLHNMAVNRGIPGTVHQDGKFTAGKLPTLTLENMEGHRGRPRKCTLHIEVWRVQYTSNRKNKREGKANAKE